MGNPMAANEGSGEKVKVFDVSKNMIEKAKEKIRCYRKLR